MFLFIKTKIKKIYTQFTNQASSIFSKNKLDDEFLKELEKLLICADTGVTTTKRIIENLSLQIQSQKIKDTAQAKDILQKQLISILEQYGSTKQELPRVTLLVGVNGSGKTSFAAKFAQLLKDQKKKVLLVAGDTFRAAAIDQLNEWSKIIETPIFIGKKNQDSASVIFDGCKKFKNEKFDHIIIDTAGRMQTKINLIKELEKIRKVLGKALFEEKIETLITIDAMLGQNSLQQAKILNEATKLQGIVLTKLDGTGKGGIIFSIMQELKLPIKYVTFGEKLSDIKKFDPKEYVISLFEK